MLDDVFNLIERVSAEGLASTLEGMFAVLTGVVVGFIYNWKMSVVCLACVPFMILGSIMNIKFQSGMSSDTDAAAKDATLLAGSQGFRSKFHRWLSISSRGISNFLL